MLQPKVSRPALVLTLLLSVSACGGGGNTNFIPTPTPAVQPPPPPPPVAQAPFGLTSDATFAAAGYGAQFRWDADSQKYEVKLAGGSWDSLQPESAVIDTGNYYPSSGLYAVSLRSDLPYRYSSLATVRDNGWGYFLGEFAFGISTPANAVPIQGSAEYDAAVFGMRADQVGVIGGSATLDFNFGTGTLSGAMNPIWKDTTDFGFAPVPLGEYKFVNTIYSTGSATFSGQLSNPGVSGLGSFGGKFTGPSAEELIAGWNAQMVDPTLNKQIDISGAMIGKH